MEVIQELNINVSITDLETEQERSSVRQDEVSRETNRLSEVTQINTPTPAESSQIPAPIDNNNINSPLSSEEEVHTFNTRPEESPPPYTSGPNPLQYSHGFGGECSLPGYNDISNRSSFGQSPDQQLYLLNQQGQMVPVHLPGQIVYGNNTLRSNEQIMSTNGRSTVMTTVISSHPTNTQHTTRLRTARNNSDDQTSYITIPIFLLIFCTVQGNLPAVCCSLCSLIFSILGNRYRKRANLSKAKRYSLLSLICNVLILVEYLFFVLTGLTLFIVFYVIGVIENI